MEVLHEVVKLTKFNFVLVHVASSFVLVILELSLTVIHKVIFNVILGDQSCCSTLRQYLVLVETEVESDGSVASSKELPEQVK